jgi:hypothetical protein
MKKLFLASILISILAIGTASATVFTFTQDQLLHMYQTGENPASSTPPNQFETDLDQIASSGSGAQYAGDLYDVNNPGGDQGGFGQLQVGLKDEYNAGTDTWFATDYDGNTTYGLYSPYDGNTLKSIHDYNIYDLDTPGYTKYSLTFTNTNEDNWLVNLYMNTGWIPGETNIYYENTWTEISPGESATVTLDFSSAHAWGGGHSGGLTTVANLDHVTSIGFNIGGNLNQAGDNPSNPDHYSIQVKPIPEPSTLILLGFGVVGVAVYGWRRKKQS